MPILKLVSAPNGAQLGYHRIAQVEGTFPHLVVAVHGWPDEQACKDEKPPLFVHRISFDGSDLRDELEAHALAHATFSGGAIVADGVTDLGTAKARKWAQLKAHRDRLMNSPVPLRDFALDADLESQVKLIGSMMRMSTNPTATKRWRCSDNVMRELGLADISAVVANFEQRTQRLIDTTDELWTRMVAATTVEQVNAIVWPDEPTPEAEPAP